MLWDHQPPVCVPYYFLVRPPDLTMHLLSYCWLKRQCYYSSLIRLYLDRHIHLQHHWKRKNLFLSGRILTKVAQHLIHLKDSRYFHFWKKCFHQRYAVKNPLYYSDWNSLMKCRKRSKIILVLHIVLCNCNIKLAPLPNLLACAIIRFIYVEFLLAVWHFNILPGWFNDNIFFWSS